MPTKRQRTDIPLGLFFLKYFGYLFIGILGVAVIAILIFNMMWASDMVYPARYAEQQALLAAPVIEEAEEVSAQIVPELCRYALFDETGVWLGGDLKEKDAERAWEAVEGRRSNMGGVIGGYYYQVIRRSGEYCVLRYQILSQYQSEALRKYLPPPEILILAVMLGMVLAVVVLTAVRFSRVMRRKLSPLIQAADRIQRQELDFPAERGNVREINDILQAMDDMRAALAQSLEEQWQAEQRKQEQMAALAHDLKTPLTLVRGNAELMCDMDLTKEQRECADCIAGNAIQMQNYVQTLIEITKSAQSPPIHIRSVETESFLSEVKRQAERLCAMYRISFMWEDGLKRREMYAEPELLSRALQNLIDNAVRYTPQDGVVSMEIREDGENVVFRVSDTGCGFSESALRHGKEQFYMDDSSRTAVKAHYGMGLYIVDTIVRQHGGTLTLENSPETGGACVTVSISGRTRNQDTTQNFAV